LVWLDPLGESLTVGGTEEDQKDVEQQLRMICPEDSVAVVEGTVTMDRVWCEKLKEGSIQVAHKFGCCCLCLLTGPGSHDWKIVPQAVKKDNWRTTWPATWRVLPWPYGCTAGFSDFPLPYGFPGVGQGGFAQVPTSKSTVDFKIYDQQGNLQEQPNWRVTAHEVCGHAFLADLGLHPPTDPADRVGYRPSENWIRVIENVIAQEVQPGAPVRGMSWEPKQHGESDAVDKTTGKSVR
jgi:hypothetical protein